jgi:metal-responsive CopG/Arc/MetJ family transcriptional regulator
MGQLRKMVMNMDEELIAQLDAWAASNHVNRTAAVSILLSTALKQDKLLYDLGRMMDAIEAQKAGSEA